MRRRRFLTIAGTAAVMAGATWTPDRLAWRWRGTALGAQATITLVHADPIEARRQLTGIAAEIDRLENIFSLYRTGSAINRLNANGRLRHPPADLVRLLGEARLMSEASQGAFDCTIQPLWQALANGTDPLMAHRLVDYRKLDIEPGEIALAEPGMAITLNGIAQGYITDRITDRLIDLGMSDILVDMGELRACGHRPDGRDWRIGIAGSDHSVALANQAIATSWPGGTVLDKARGLHHLLDPATGKSSDSPDQVSIIAATATLADAASTACAILPKAARTALCARLQVHRIDSAPLQA